MCWKPWLSPIHATLTPGCHGDQINSLKLKVNFLTNLFATPIFGQFLTQMAIVKRSQGQLHTSNLTLNKKWMGIENLEQHSRLENQIPCIDF
jgi:hypothetical protein